LLREWHIYDRKHLAQYTKTQRKNSYIIGLIEVLEHLALELHKRGLQQFGEDKIRLVLEPFLNALYNDRPSHELKKC
jgi:hypothetical protein